MLARAAPPAEAAWPEQPAGPDAPQVLQLTDLTDALRDQALALASQAGGAVPAEAELTALLARADFVQRLRLALAAALAGLLGRHDPRIVAVYGCQPPRAWPAAAAGPGAVAIQLLVVVTAPSAALQAFIGSLQRSLAASLGALPAYRHWPRAFVLEVSVLTQPAFQGGLDFVRSFSAEPAPLTRLWPGPA